MSKSGSRYGRRSNWFKIHCLLQEQQAHKNNNNNNNSLASNNNNDTSSSNSLSISSTNNNNNGSSNNSSSGLLPNGFLPSSFLSNLCNNNNNNNVAIKKEMKPSSPCDSGASSADPEESTSTKDSLAAYNHTISAKVEVPEVTLTKISPKVSRIPATSSALTTASTTDSFRPLLDRMSPYLHHGAYRPDASPYFPMPFAIPPVSLALIANSKHDHHEQHEPIDLSMKSKSSNSSDSPLRLESASPLLGDVSDPEQLPSSATSISRPVPLDLTFVRTKPLSG
ncbi:phosphatidylinositol 3-kinase 2-like isoform X2 [Toxorhynchites rutilus septentrionalis]|nr:phosphatidylinositol 3-kinase 2-like isoform X2 [Toxorhynchites rutilus septentrionalis]